MSNTDNANLMTSGATDIMAGARKLCQSAAAFIPDLYDRYQEFSLRSKMKDWYYRRIIMQLLYDEHRKEWYEDNSATNFATFTETMLGALPDEMFGAHQVQFEAIFKSELENEIKNRKQKLDWMAKQVNDG